MLLRFEFMNKKERGVGVCVYVRMRDCFGCKQLYEYMISKRVIPESMRTSSS